MRRFWRVVRLLVILSVLAGGVYWGWFLPVRVTARRVARGEIVAEVMGTGTLETHFRATISAKISGLITKVLVDQGHRVTAGQALVQLDDSDLKRQVEIGQASVAAATAGLDRLRADKARALAVLAQARREHTRLQGLMAEASAASVELDRAVEALGVAEADLARAEAGIVEGQKQLDSAEQTLEYYRAKLADTIIKAPFDGLIIRRDRDPGGVVVPGSSILMLISTDEIWVSAWVDETEMARLKPGQTARVVFRSEPGRSYKGEVARLGREADRETREFVVDVLVRELPENWAVGQRAEVYIETGHRPDTVILRSSDLVWRDSRPGVFVEHAGCAAWRPLKLGLRGRETVEVLEDLRPGESVIVPADPKTPLRDGQRVKSR
jgi:HlyD family secretion protein